MLSQLRINIECTIEKEFTDYESKHSFTNKHADFLNISEGNHCKRAEEGSRIVSFIGFTVWDVVHRLIHQVYMRD